jgi:Putative prokaryotic signal transducing protein
MGNDRMEDSVRELISTNDVALISAIEALLIEAGIPHQILDRQMSVIQGSIGAIPQRILVADDYEPAARELLVEAGLTRAEAEPASTEAEPEQR